jgi:lysophospholipase
MTRARLWRDDPREAPLRADLAEGPPQGRAIWLRATDGVRTRLALWPAPGASATALILPGRTEYCEKYGPVVRGLVAAGLAVAVIDWRGQGLADRLTPDAMLGHVSDFAEYQLDLDAAVATLAGLAALGEIPPLLHLLGHSMGGAIGLRALHRGLGIASATFSAPMWGIARPGLPSGLLRWLTGGLGQIGLGAHHVPGPGGGPASYVATARYEGNVLTRDPVRFAALKSHLRTEPRFGLGGPSIAWVNAALRECRALAALPSPPIPALTLLGSLEAVVDPAAIRARMAHWPGGRLETVQGGRHEVLMDPPQLLAGHLRMIAAHMLTATGQPTDAKHRG